MTPEPEAPENVLIVDDEGPVRETFRGWLERARLGCRVLTASDAETALRQAEATPIHLAVLDWNLGAGIDGLHLLEDLRAFAPDVVAIMVTAFANLATPLQAMRMGVRDYLDKNHDLNPETFVDAVRRQLEQIRPARRERRFNQGLRAFRDAVEQVLPLVQASAALHDPVPLSEGVRSLFRFLQRTTGARDGVLLARSYDESRQPAELCRAYDISGAPLEGPLAPFARSVAGAVVGMGQPEVVERPEEAGAALELHPFEKGRRTMLAAPITLGAGIQVVVELFDKQDEQGRPASFAAADRRLAQAAADFGAELLRHALAERQTHQVLFDAVAAAVRASEDVARSLERPAEAPAEAAPPAAVLQELQRGLEDAVGAGPDSAQTVRLAEAIRGLAVRYGPPAVGHCIRLVEGLRGLLDEVTAAGEA
jgi:ActR/RegA family two-component response regulator